MVGRQKDHDEICADIVERISELGGFKVEFPVYLTCYADKGTCYYYVSSEKQNVYDFIDEKLKENLYCIPPVRKAMKTIVSAGQKDELYQQFKVIAAKELMHEGAGNVACLLPTFAPKSTNVAQDILEQMRICLKGINNEELRQLYRGLLDMAYYAKKINGVFYNKTLEWLNIEEMRQEEESIAHAVHERVYSGFAYFKPEGQLAYYTNAVFASTLLKREELMSEGTIVSPILQKKYCFNDINAIGNVVMAFKSVLKKYLNQKFMELLLEIMGNNNEKNPELDQAINISKSNNNLLAMNCLKYYKTLWQID